MGRVHCVLFYHPYLDKFTSLYGQNHPVDADQNVYDIAELTRVL